MKDASKKKKKQTKAQQATPVSTKSGRVTLTGQSQYVVKDQAKADKATKFIGRGSTKSSTARYAKDFGDRANTGKYTSKDVVFVSAEGARNGRVDPDFAELQRAIDAGAQFVTDVKTDRDRPYNKGERQVAEFLLKNGYVDNGKGIWKKQVTPKKKTVSKQKFISREDVKNNPETLYVFGDNDVRKGFGGQAKAMRGEKNSVGIRTKKAPSNKESAFYKDEELAENIRKIDEDFAPLFETDKSVVIPEDGLGTGLSQMQKYAPKTLAHIEKRIAELVSGKPMSPVVSDTKVEEKPEPKVIAEDDIDLIDDGDTSDQTTPEQVDAAKTEQTEPATEQEVKAKTLKELLSDLIKAADGKNHFLKTFSLSQNRSKMLEQDDAIKTLLREVPGLNSAQSKDLSEMLNTLVPALQSYLDNMAKTAILNPKKGWFEKLLDDAKDVLGYNEASSLNFRRTNEAGKGEFHPKAVQAFALATAEFILLTESRPERNLDQEDINDRLGRRKDHSVSKRERFVVEHGPQLQNVIDQISENAMKIMGVTADKNQPVKFSQGIFRGMAANVIHAMTDEKGLNWLNAQTLDLAKGRTYTSFSLNKDNDLVKRAAKSLKNKQDIFGDVFLEKPEPEFFFEPQKETENSVTRQRFNKVSGTVKKVLERLQSTPNRFVAPMMELRSSVGDDLFKKWGGYREYDPELTNESDAVRIDSRNKSIERALSGIDLHFDAAKAEAERTGQTEYQVKTYFKWAISSVGRLQQQGFVTPQGDKIARDMISSTHSVLDLNNEKHVKAVWLAAAQALGLKVEKSKNDKVVEKVQKMLNDPSKLRPAVDLLKNWMSDPDSLDGDALDQAFINSGVEISMKGIHALLTVAQMEYVLDPVTGDPAEAKSFSTALSFEADGKTDGPINAMINAGYGPFTEDQVRNMAKGGLIVSGSQMSLNRYIEGDGDGVGNNAKHEKDGEDLYQLAAKLFETYLPMFSGSWGDPVFDVMNAFLDDFMFKNGKVEIQRGFIKNPLTVFLYGSGESGIAGKMADAIKGNIYSMLTEIAEQRGERKEDGTLKTWKDHEIFLNNPGLEQKLSQVFNVDFTELLNNPVKAEITYELETILSGKIENAVAEAMTAAIDEATGGLRIAMEKVRMATQIQAIAFQNAFRKEIAKRAKERGAKDLLTEKDYEFAFQSASQVAPIYGNGVQEFHIVASEKYDGQTEVSRSLRGDLRSGATVPQPGDAGVKGQPYLVIGTGDGKMIINILEDGDIDLDTSLVVFDGVEMSLSTIFSGSEQINKAVWKGWMEESVTGIAYDGYKTFLRQFDMNNLDAEAMKALEKMAKRQKMTVSQMVENLDNELGQMAKENRARKNAVARMNVSVDHMAGAESPHVNKGAIIDSNTPFDPALAAEMLNEFYYEELAKMDEKDLANSKAPAVQRPTKELMAFLAKAGTQVEGTKAVMLTGSQIEAAFGRGKGFDEDQLAVYQDLVRTNPQLKQHTFYVGSSTELEKVRAKIGIQDKTPIQHGVIYPMQQVAFVSNMSPESLLHEVLHAQTARTLIDHYANPSQSADYVQEAMTRLEQLMGFFQKMNFSRDTAEDKAANILQSELRKYEGSPDAKMSEFLSWTLSNQNLIKIGKDTKVYSPLQKMISNTIKALKKLVGIKTQKADDFFSNIRFNAEVVIKGSQKGNSSLDTLKAEIAAETKFEQVYGTDENLRMLNSKFNDRVRASLEAFRATLSDKRPKRQDQEVRMRALKMTELAERAAERLESAGFHMDQREKATFTSIHVAMMAGYGVNSAAQKKANDLYAHLIKVAKPGSFAALIGPSGFRKDAENQSDLLASFVALGLVHPRFQEELAQLEGPKTFAEFEGSIDGVLKFTANTTINYLTDLTAGNKAAGRDMRTQLLSLEDSLARIQESRQTAAERLVMKPGDKVNEYVSGLINKASKKTVSFVRSNQKATDGNLKATGLMAAEMIAALGSKEESAVVGKVVTKMLNEQDSVKFIQEFWTELQGMTTSNEQLLNMINKVRSHIDGKRQDHREDVPKILADQFTRELEKEEWSQLFDGIAKTDLISYGRKESLRLLKDLTKLPAEIAKVEKKIQSMDSKNFVIFKEKANALAEFMVTGEVISNSLQMNAEAIALRLGESIGNPKADPDLVEAIDDLTSLYALQKTDQVKRDKLEELANSEPEGMNFLLGYTQSTKDMEANRVSNGKEGKISRFNARKGYALVQATPGHTVIVMKDSKHEEMIRKGYTKVGTYHGDPYEGSRETRSYYQSTVGGRPSFRQGVAQSVHESYFGVDPRTGASQTGDTAGVIYGKAAQRIKARIGKKKNNLPAGTERLIPIYDDKRQIYAYQRSMDPKKLEATQPDTHMGRVLGAWSGRIVEETLANTFNKGLIQTIKKMYDDATPEERRSQFINMADPNIKDPVIRDAWNVMGYRLKQNAKDVFAAEDTFMVRKDMANVALGFHSASVRDAWTGTSRWKPEAQEAFRTAATVIFGTDAYKRLVQFENGLKSVVSYAKQTMLIRSMTIILDNGLSNALHLMTWNIGPIEMARSLTAKFLETNQHVKNQERTLELTAELAANLDNAGKVRRIKAELQAIEDANKKLSIWPLIQAGEFSTISEGLTEADVAISNGDLAGYIDKLTDKLPSGVKTLAKNAAITKDTALFQGLNRALQYGDFLAKAVLYDNLMTEKKYSQKDAMKVIREEFVNYNVPTGRDSDYLEATGMLWFPKYKIKIMKILLKMVRERPVSALVFAGGLGPMTGVDTVYDGSGLGTLIDGRMPYLWGPEMGVDALTMNPWANLVN